MSTITRCDSCHQDLAHMPSYGLTKSTENGDAAPLHFCSMECLASYSRRQVIGSDESSWRVAPIPGNPFWRVIQHEWDKSGSELAIDSPGEPSIASYITDKRAAFVMAASRDLLTVLEALCKYLKRKPFKPGDEVDRLLIRAQAVIDKANGKGKGGQVVKLV